MKGFDSLPGFQYRSLQTNSNPPQDLHAFGVNHITRGIGRISEGIMTKGEGSWVVYDDGRRMLDFTCGIGVTNLGACFMSYFVGRDRLSSSFR